MGIGERFEFEKTGRIEPENQAKLNRFWVSWVDSPEDYRPLTFPPNKAILGWWCSGEDLDGNANICALVQARHEADARDAILQEWPEALERGDWRFFERVEDNWIPGDRFPLSDWMRERVEK